MYKPLRNRGKKDWQIWRYSVLERDNFECQHCNTEEQLVAHHIIPLDEDESLIFEVSNGLTLCRSCHARHHSKDCTNYISFKGEKRSDEFKEKIRATLTGVKHTEERKRNQSLARLRYLEKKRAGATT